MSTKNKLLKELILAHKIILNALNLMTTEQKMQWAHMNDITACGGDGATRANERLGVIDTACAELDEPTHEVAA